MSSDGSSIGQAFEAVFRQKERAQIAKASAWRAHTLQTFSPFIDADPTTDEEDIQRNMLIRLNHSYTGLAISFKTMLAPLLKSVTGREALKRHDELFSMCKEAGNLAYKLWSQKARMTVAKFSRNNKHFDIESPFMQPHASMLCDYDSHEYDGIAVQLCIEPAIIAYGNERGQEYDDYKIWAPAIVWIAKEMAATSSSRPSVADRLTSTVDVQTKLDPDLEEADFKEDAMGERPTKKVRLSQPVSPTLVASVGAGPYTKQYRESQGLENLKTELNSLPALSMTNTICYEYSASKSSAGDTASLTNSLEKRRESAKNNSGTARLQEENRSNCSGRNISLASTKPDVELGKNRRDYRADEAGIRKMSQFERALAQACSRETTYERELKFRKSQPAEPRPMDKSTTTDRDFVLGCDRSDLTWPDLTHARPKIPYCSWGQC